MLTEKQLQELLEKANKSKSVAWFQSTLQELVAEVRNLKEKLGIDDYIPTKEEILRGDYDGGIICPKLIDEDDEYINNDVYVCTFACSGCFMKNDCPSLNDIEKNLL